MPTDDQLRVAHTTALENFAASVDGIADDQWDLGSPCDGWTVFDVVEHVAMGNQFVVEVCGGRTAEEAIPRLVPLDPDGAPYGAQLRATLDAARQAFEIDLDTTVAHPVGEIPARMFLGFRLIDQLGHTWDVATATGQSLAIDASALAVAADVADEGRWVLDSSSNFATTADDHTDSDDPLIRFLTAIGRQPA